MQVAVSEATDDSCIWKESQTYGLFSKSKYGAIRFDFIYMGQERKTVNCLILSFCSVVCFVCVLLTPDEDIFAEM